MKNYRLNPQFESARRAVKAKSTTRTAVLGDETQNIYSDRTGFYFARPVLSADDNGNGQLGPTFYLRANPAASIMPKPGRKVQYKKDERNQFVIVSSDFDDLLQSGIDPIALEPNDPYKAFRYLSELVNLNSYAVSGLKVSVREWQYQTADNTIKVFTGTTSATHVDLTSYVPAVVDTHRYALLVFNITQHLAAANPLQVYASTAISLFTALGESDLQDCYTQLPIGEIIAPIKAYSLEYGQTAVAGIAKDLDVRQFINVAGVNAAQITGTLPILHGGTGQTTKAAAYDALSPTTTQGDVEFRNATTNTRLGIGTAGQVLTVNAGATAPEWKTPTASGGTVTSVGLSTDASYLTIGSTPVTTSGTITANKTTGLAANRVVATPDGGTGTADLRALVLADLPLSARASSLIINATAGEAWAIRDNLYFDTASATWFKIDNDAVPLRVGTLRGVATANALISSTDNTIQVRGTLSGYSGLTAGGAVYASGTAGAYTQTRPTVSAGGGQVVICEMGTALSTTEIYINPMPLEFLKRESLASNASLTITHISDPQGRARETAGYVASNDIALAETYASINQDAAAQLKGQSGAGATITADSVGGTAYALGDAGDTDSRQSQSMTVTAGILSQITFRTRTNVGSPTGTVTLSVRADSAGIPSASLLWSQAVTITSNAAHTVDITGGPFLAAGTYWIVWQAAIQTTNNRYVLDGSAASVYPGGVSKADTTTTGTFPGTWTVSNAGDLRCTLTTSAVTLYDRIAQGVSHSSSIQPTTINLWLKKTGTPTGNLTCSLFSDSGGSPNAVITNGASNTVAASTLTTSYGWITFTFATSPTLSSSTQYHIVLSTSDTASNTNYVEWGIDTSSPSYPNGVIKTETSSVWSATPTADGCFELYAITATYDEPVVIGRYSAGTRDVGVRYDDGAGASGDTKTTFKNVSGGTLDLVCAVRME